MSQEAEPRDGAEPRRWIADRLTWAVERPRKDSDRPRKEPDRPRKDSDRSRKEPDRPRREFGVRRESGSRKDSGTRKETERPRREVVTSPRTMAPRHPRYPVTREIDEQTHLGEVYMRSLIRTQLRLALFVCTVLGCVVCGLPLLFLLVPDLREVQLAGIPLPWAVLAGLIYPAFVIGAWLYVRQAERNERHFAELVDRAR
ncbi:hypothetical protein [Streptosporangium sp. 'caverna']|uniref:hypothetical protein n=1 Tax=Streptosporangium sp. 'caverna' TaxID=2202249 RepID=UPI0019550424|nr:hypothetical protein [Streptosporangium sp. 'caverna']